MDKIAAIKNKVKRESWITMLEEQQRSGLSAPKWCSSNGISIKTFYYRLRRLREEAIEEKQEIIPLHHQPAQIAAPAVRQEPITASITIRGNGITAELPVNVSTEVISAVMRGLHQC